MSDENAPKLRLKPKLSADPSAASPAPAGPAPTPAAPSEPAPPPAPATPAAAAPASTPEAPKLVRLKPKLTPGPAQETAASAAPAAETSPAPTPAVPAPVESAPPAAAPSLVRPKPKLTAPPVEAAAPQPAPAAPAASEAVPAPPPPTPAPEAPSAEPAKPKFSFKPKSAAPQPAAAPAPAAGPVPPPPGASMSPPVATAAGADAAPVLNAPPPVPKPVETDRGENGEPGEITAMRKASGAPFPPPPGAGKFPPPPGLKKALAEASEEAEKESEGADKKTTFKEKLFKYGVIAALILIALAWKAGKYLLDRTVNATIEHKLFDKEETAPKPGPATPQGQAVAKAQTVTEQAQDASVAPVNQVLEAEKPAVVAPTTAPTPTETAAAAEPAVAVQQPPPEPVKPVAPLPPPPASVAFRGWVENLKITGLRGGANPRLFIGGTAYQKGDVINPQLGITFEAYDDATRTITFRDKTGAKVERKN